MILFVEEQPAMNPACFLLISLGGSDLSLLTGIFAVIL